MSEMKSAFQAILDGYPVHVDRYLDGGTGEWLAFLCVPNPEYEPDNGESSLLVIDVRRFLNSLTYLLVLTRPAAALHLRQLRAACAAAPPELRQSARTAMFQYWRGYVRKVEEIKLI